MERKTSKWVVVTAVVAIAILLAGFVLFLFRDRLMALFFAPTQSSLENSAVTGQSDPSETTTFAKGLVTPWSIAFLPDGDMLVTERDGRLQRVGQDGKTFTIEGVYATNESGLLGVAVDPDFSDNQRLYLYYTVNDGGTLSNRVSRFRLAGDALSDKRDILTGIPAAGMHDGGAIKFGPDDKLYVTTGDASQPGLAQDRSSLAGKILRLETDGSIPNGNPFGTLVWSYGHRNPQGLSWDKEGRLWAVEHGPSGTASGRDELNLITSGGNYGWPTITGDEKRDGMISPVAQSGDSETWAPSGMAYLDGSLFFAGLRGQSLYQAKIGSDGTSVTLTRHFAEKYGRLRAVAVHDGDLYFSTSNRDGRGSPKTDDDKIIKISNASVMFNK